MLRLPGKTKNFLASVLMCFVVHHPSSHSATAQLKMNFLRKTFGLGVSSETPQAQAVDVAPVPAAASSQDVSIPPVVTEDVRLQKAAALAALYPADVPFDDGDPCASCDAPCTTHQLLPDWLKLDLTSALPGTVKDHHRQVSGALKPSSPLIPCTGTASGGF